MKCIHCGSEWNVSPGLSVSITNCPFCGKSLLPEKKQLNTVEDVLVEINRLCGISVLADETKLVAYFSDLAPQLSRQRRILGYFVECGGPKKIVSAMNASDDEQSICIKQIVREMKDEMYIEEAASQMICEAFLYAVSGRRPTAVSTVSTYKTSQISGNQPTVPRKPPLSTTTEEESQKIIENPFDAKSGKANGSGQDAAVTQPPHKAKQTQIEKQAADRREQLRKDILRACTTGEGSGNRIDVLVVQHQITRYLASGMTSFHKKVDKAIRAYAGAAARETPLLMEDNTILGSAKEGFVLTEKTLYWNRGFLEGKGQCHIEDITAVSTYTSSDGKLFRIQLKLEQPASTGATINISSTIDKEESARLESFWKELLLLNM